MRPYTFGKLQLSICSTKAPRKATLKLANIKELGMPNEISRGSPAKQVHGLPVRYHPCLAFEASPKIGSSRCVNCVKVLPMSQDSAKILIAKQPVRVAD